MYIECLISLSSAHEKWGQKQKCCVYNFVQCIYIRDGSRFSNIRIFYLIIEYRLGCAIYFLKVYQGLTIKTVRWLEGRSDLSLTRSGHCRWSLNCIICMRFKPCLFTNVSDSKAFGRERQLLSVHARCVLLCEQRVSLFCLWHARAAWTGKHMKYV